MAENNSNGAGVNRALASLTLGGDVYTPRNILLTGGAGFIGSHAAIKLVQQYPHYKYVLGVQA